MTKPKNMCEVADRLKTMGKKGERRRIIRTKLEKGQSFEQIADALELSLEQVMEIARQQILDEEMKADDSCLQ